MSEMLYNLQKISISTDHVWTTPKLTKLTIKEHVGPQGNNGLIWVPDEENGLAVAKGQVGRPDGACTYDVCKN